MLGCLYTRIQQVLGRYSTWAQLANFSARSAEILPLLNSMRFFSNSLFFKSTCKATYGRHSAATATMEAETKQQRVLA